MYTYMSFASHTVSEGFAACTNSLREATRISLVLSELLPGQWSNQSLTVAVRSSDDSRCDLLFHRGLVATGFLGVHRPCASYTYITPGIDLYTVE